MASEQLWSQVAEKWQTSFNRLNRNEPGITGLLSFSEVRCVTSIRVLCMLTGVIGMDACQRLPPPQGY